MRYSDLIRQQKLFDAELKAQANPNSPGYLFLQNVITTFSGKFTNKTDFIPFNRIQEDFFRYLYTNPYLYFYYNKTKNKCYLLTKVSDNNYMDLLENKQIVLLDDNVIKTRWDANMFRYQAWMELCDQMATLERIYLVNVITDMKKFKLLTNDDSDEIIQAEIDNFLKIDPFIIQRDINPEGNIGNEIVELTSSSKTPLAMNNLIDWWNWKADKLGWMTAQEQKLERKTFAEGQIDLSNTLYMERLVLNNLKVFAYDVKEKWDIDLDFDPTVDITPETLISDQPNQEEPDNFIDDEELIDV